MTRAQGWSVARILVATLALSPLACSRGGGNPLAPDAGSGPVFAVITCEVANPDGSCNKKTCKEDAKGNCQKFGEACIKYDNHYSGTAKEGTCSRVL